MQLTTLAEGDETKAIAIIKNSMANGWKGFFETKTTKLNGKANNKISDSFRREVYNDILS
jgi:hypothetical protein